MNLIAIWRETEIERREKYVRRIFQFLRFFLSFSVSDDPRLEIFSRSLSLLVDESEKGAD